MSLILIAWKNQYSFLLWLISLSLLLCHYVFSQNQKPSSILFPYTHIKQISVMVLDDYQWQNNGQMVNKIRIDTVNEKNIAQPYLSRLINNFLFLYKGDHIRITFKKPIMVDNFTLMNRILMRHSDNIHVSQSFFNQLRAHFFNQLNQKLSQLNYSFPSLYWALFFGKRSYLNQFQKSFFYDLGLVHILALSGLHLSILISFLLFFHKNLPFKKISIIPIVFIIGVYVFLVGEKITLYRALVLAIFFFIQKFLGKRPAIENLSFTYIILAILFPSLIFTWSSHLSFLSFLAIIYIYPPIHKSLSSLFFPLFSSLISLGVSISFLLIPIIYFQFNHIHVLSFIWTIVLLPFFFVFLVISLFWSLTLWINIPVISQLNSFFMLSLEVINEKIFHILFYIKYYMPASFLEFRNQWIIYFFLCIAVILSLYQYYIGSQKNYLTR